MVEETPLCHERYAQPGDGRCKDCWKGVMDMVMCEGWSIDMEVEVWSMNRTSEGTFMKTLCATYKNQCGESNLP